jgi:diacylglycerol kinase (ATP)
MEESPFKGKTGLRRLLNAFGYSVHGFASAFRHEDAFRQEVLLAAVLIPVALVLDVGGIGKAMMIASVLLVLIVELLNSAIEAAVDRISLDRHSLSKRAKDIGSAAVFLSLVNVAAVWMLVLVEKL